MNKNIKIALIGNPNTGKTSIFNQLTGLNQKIGNYPGITVEKKEGICKLPDHSKAKIIDLPGTYSLNTTSIDENVVVELLLNKNNVDYPDILIVVTDVENLKRNLLLFTQTKDLEIPSILVINMSDRMRHRGISLDIPCLEKHLKTKIALVSSRKGQGIDYLKELIVNYKTLTSEPCFNISDIDATYFDSLRKAFPNETPYKLWLIITQDLNFTNLKQIELPNSSFTKSELKKLQQKETIKRYQLINNVLKEGLKIDLSVTKSFRSVLDKILMHKIFGYLIFFSILLLIFQAIFDWSKIPADFIDETFASLSTYLNDNLPNGIFTDLVTQGIIPGIGGISVFIPPIAFLFLFISILEESGYMSRVVFLMDKIMKKFGLSGKSVVPLIAGTACSIPAIMATRNIENWKERLITILVTPFITCSARLPVYTIIISLVIPNERIFGLFNLQGLMLLFLYLLGFITAIFSAYILNTILRIKIKTFFVIEMPSYKLPLLKNVFYNVIERTKAFVYGAGKIILAISIILWFLASYSPDKDFSNVANQIIAQKHSKSISDEDLENKIALYKLENSYIGHIGKIIEPIIRPLGYDWKIGIAIITSFAAREVFVGTLATIYSIGNSDNEDTIRNRMAKEVSPDTGKKIFNFASGCSLLLFYAFAMQCASTIAITKRETNGWKWPIIQLTFMSSLAYITALVTYQLLK